MEPYQVLFTRAAQKELVMLPDAIADRISAAIGRLAGEPRGAGSKQLWLEVEAEEDGIKRVEEDLVTV